MHHRSLGAIMFEMMVGYPPFYSDDPLTTCRKIVNWRMFLKFPDEIQVRVGRASRLAPGAAEAAVAVRWASARGRIGPAPVSVEGGARSSVHLVRGLPADVAQRGGPQERHW